jgi:muramoyltetrapeptide carboxypeptidase LdcA involved in peptidoglycan recycling
MGREFVVPPVADPVDRVAVIAPSSGLAAMFRPVFELAVNRLGEYFDVEPVVDPTARQSGAYLGAHPEARAAAIHAAFRDPEISAVFATIGGEDQIRVLSHLDGEVLRANPTRFFGMSDNTNLAAFLWQQGIVSNYGGQLLNQIATPDPLPEYTERYVHRALFEDSIGDLAASERWTDDVVSWDDPDYPARAPEYDDNEGWRWHGDRRVEGRTWGGCLTVLRWLLAADVAIPSPEALDGCVLVLETSEELPDAREVGWMLRSMGERGLLERFDGVLVGRPRTRNRFEDPGPDEREQYATDQRAAIREQLDRYNPGATVVFDLDFGHTNPTAPIPIGGRVEVDPDNETIHFP